MTTTLVEQRLIVAGWQRCFRVSSDPEVPDAELERWIDSNDQWGPSLPPAEALKRLDADHKEES